MADNETGAARELACFELAGAHYALDLAQVREISRCPALVPLPHAPPAIEGVADLRGRALPVVDLARLLGRVPLDSPARTRLIVVEAAGLVLGLRVSDAIEIVSAGEAEQEALPERLGSDVVCAVARRAGGPPLLLLSLEALIGRLDPARAREEAA